MIAHFRPLLFTFIALILGIYVGYTFFYVSKVIFYLSLIVCFVLVNLLIVSLCTHKNKVFDYIHRRKKAIICCVTFFVLGATTFNVMYYTYQPECKLTEYQTYYVVGTVKTNYSHIVTDDYDRIRFLVKDATVLVGDESVKLRKNLYVSVNVTNFEESSLYNLSVNDDIVLQGKFHFTPVFDDYLYEYAYKNNFEYSVYASDDDVVLYNKVPVGLDAVRERVHDVLYQNMTPKYASLAYSVLIGDRSGLDDELSDNLKVTGLAHIVAVSGLHVGFLVVLILLLCKLCRIKKGWVQFLLTAGVLIFYCLLCNMTPSVTRASIMAIVLMSAKAFRKQNDSLSSISLAGIIILCMHPLYVFDISFQLSFGAVFAIILFVPLFRACYKKLQRKKLIAKAFDTLNLSLSAQIGTLPFIMKSFHYVSSFSLLVNIFIVPLFGFVYMFLFVSTLIGCIIPLFGGVLYVPELCFVAIDYITSFVASIPYSTIAVGVVVPMVIFLWFGSLFSISDKCLLNKRKKYVFSGSLIYSLVLTTIFGLVLL